MPFFDALAGLWDGWHDLAELRRRLDGALEAFGVGPSETVADVGCGTGNLTLALLGRLGAVGRVVAVDISPAMLACARQKADDPRVTWALADASRLPVAAASCDRVICFSSWPHFRKPQAAVSEFRRALRPGGRAHVLHFLSREQVNRIHAEARDPAVRGDLLAPAGEVAALFEAGGFGVCETADEAGRYLLTVERRG